MHLSFFQAIHVISQVSQPTEPIDDKDPSFSSTIKRLLSEKSQTYQCLWKGCKVYGMKSCSRSWLEKHVLPTHGGKCAFACIVSGCKQRFGSQVRNSFIQDIYIRAREAHTVVFFWDLPRFQKGFFKKFPICLLSLFHTCQQ